MITRLEGAKGWLFLVETVRGQTILNGNAAAAEFIAKIAKPIEVPAGQPLITQGAYDNDPSPRDVGGTR
jgi:hypothetical protein